MASACLIHECLRSHDIVYHFNKLPLINMWFRHEDGEGRENKQVQTAGNTRWKHLIQLDKVSSTIYKEDQSEFNCNVVQ